MTRISTDPDPVRWALAGYGSGGRIFHAPLIASAPGLELAAVVTGSPERAAQARAEYPGAAVVPDIEALAELGVRGVSISTPPATHVPLARRALAAGLDVVLDKPFALTAEEASALVADADGRGRLLIPYFNRRWDNDFLTVRRLVESGRLGTVHRLTSRLDRSRPIKPGWPSDPDLGGGTLLDLGPHLIDQALVLLGPAVTVSAELDVRRKGRDSASDPSPDSTAVAEDDIQLSLRHASGARSTLAAGLASPATGPRFLVQGSRAGVGIEGFDIQEAQLKQGSSPLSLGEAWGADPEASALVTDAVGTAVTEPDGSSRSPASLTVPDGSLRATQSGPAASRQRASLASASLTLERGRWDTFYPAVAAAVCGLGQVPVDPRDAVATAWVIDAARVSARIGQSVTIDAVGGSGE